VKVSLKLPNLCFQDDKGHIFMCHPLHYGAIRPSRDVGQCNLIVIFVKGESKQILANGGCNTTQVPCTHRMLVNWLTPRLQTEVMKDKLELYKYKYKGRGGKVENLALSQRLLPGKMFSQEHTARSLSIKSRAREQRWFSS